MTLSQQFIAFAGTGLLIMFCIHLINNRLQAKGRKPVHMIVLLLSPLAALIPLQGLPLYFYARGAIGDLSITTLLLILALSIQRYAGFTIVDKGSLKALKTSIPVAGIILYPAALGIAAPDPYSLGFEGMALPLILLFAAIWAWLRHHVFIAIVICFSVLLSAIQAMESDNLWDYIIDPVIFLVFLSSMIRQHIGKIMQSRKRTDPS